MHTVVCLHASTSTARQWRLLKENCCAEIQLITPNLLGYGDNPLPSWPFSIEDEVDYLSNLLADCPPFHLIGHSYGGFIALKMALRRPEQILSLALYEPTNIGPLATYDKVAFDEIWQIARLVSLLVSDGRHDDAAALFVDYWNGEGSWELLGHHARKGVAAGMSKVRLEFADGLKNGVDAAALQTIDIPTLLLMGSKTTAACRAATHFLYDHLSHVELVELANLGHMGPVTHPAVVNPYLTEFLMSGLAPTAHVASQAAL